MNNINIEAGVVYDTILFLREYNKNPSSTSHSSNLLENNYYKEIEKEFLSLSVTIPKYFNLLFYNFDYIQDEVFSLSTLSEYTKKKVIAKFENERYIKQVIVKSLFPNMKTLNVSKLLNKSQAFPYELLVDSSLPQEIISSLLYFLQYYNQFKTDLLALFFHIYDIVSSLHLNFLQANETQVREFHSQRNLNTLAAILEIPSLLSTETEAAFTLLDVEAFLYAKKPPFQFLLGSHYQSHIEISHKFLHSNLFSFSLSIGHEVKYDIYKALQVFPFLSTLELSSKLHKSKTAIKYHLDDMISEQIIVISHIKSQTNYYSLNSEYLNHMLKILTEQVKILENLDKNIEQPLDFS